MKKSFIQILSFLLIFASNSAFISCQDDETYGEKKEKEQNTIKQFLSQGALVIDSLFGDTILYVPPIKVIDEAQFAKQDSITNVDENEYVLLSKTGIYMQVMRKGCGKKLTSGETSTVLMRFLEYNLSGDSIYLRNNNVRYVAVPDAMSCTNNYGNYTGSFLYGIFCKEYGTTSVPEGWLVPLAYINLGRQATENEDIAKVRLIVPHSSGHGDAQRFVNAYFYEISYERGR